MPHSRARYKMHLMAPTSQLFQHLAFAPCCPLRHAVLARPFSSTTPIRRRPRAPYIQNYHATLQSFPDTDSSDQAERDEDISEEDYDAAYENLFVDENERSFWDDLNVRDALRPITEEEKAVLRSKLPLRVANFLIRRAEDVERLQQPGADESFFGKLLKDLPPDLPEQDDEEYRDYVFEPAAGPPAFRRRGSILFGGGDGFPDVEDTSMDADVIDVGAPKNIMSLFVGRVGSVDEQAARVGYTLLALFVGLILFKILFAFVSFFVSFTFSFFAIFALSAGIFMVFFFFKW